MVEEVLERFDKPYRFHIVGGTSMARLRRPPFTRAFALVFALGLLVVACATPAAEPARPPTHVVLVSVDGLRPAAYLPRPGAPALMPVLDALRTRGSWAEAVEGQYPSLTYPSHTSIVTGVRPGRHGIVHNTKFDPGRGNSDWYFESEAVRVPALWTWARAAGLRVGAVSWPVTVGAPIDYLFPETHQAPPGRTWLDLVREQSTPGLIDAVVERLGGFGPRDNLDYAQRDRFAAAAAVHIVEHHRPHLLLVHLVEADGAQHAHGPDSAEARSAFARVDERLGEIVEAVERAGLAEDTAWVVTGDHGFYRVHSAFQPNAVLRAAGLLQVDASGGVTAWRAMAHRATIRLSDAADAALARRVETLFRDLAEGPYRGLFSVVGRDEVRRLGGDPDAFLMIEPIDGYTVAAGTAGGFLVPTSRRGDHGYLPTAPAMHTGLVLAGAGIARGVVVPLARQIDIAPTVARLLGLKAAGTDGIPMAGVLTSPGELSAGSSQSFMCGGWRR
jgi:arylsulfatase A-like enzyme